MVNKEKVSSIKPEVIQRPKPDIDWNNGDLKAYTDIGLEPPNNVCRFQLKFLNEVDIRKGPIERTVRRMFRFRAPDCSTPKKERKEWLTYEEEWEGKDWRNVPLYMRNEHLEGVYTKQFLRQHLNQQTGEVEYMEHDLTKRELVYTIPFSKKRVDDIISRSAKTDKDSITYVIKFASEDCPWGPRMATRNVFSYEQFAEWKWEDVYKWHVKPEIESARELQDKNKTAYRLSHEPS